MSSVPGDVKPDNKIKNLDPGEVTALTYRWDRLRGAGQGTAETCWTVFALLIAIRVFSAEDSIKQFIPMGMGLGLLFSPVGLSLANRLQLPVSWIVSSIWLAVAIFLGGMGLAGTILPYVICVMLAQAFSSQSIPMMTHIYSQNYPSHLRGRLLSTNFLIASSFGIVFGFLGGKILDWNVSVYPLLFMIGILAALVAADACRRIPSQPACTLRSGNPLKSLVIAWNDRLFRTMLIAWMLMGLGNLMLIPIRVEYLANPLYGINASNAQISILLVSTVLLFRLLSTRVWGILFDRINVVTLRISLNMVFSLSIACFFFTTKIWLMAIGCALLGTAFGGGGILWTLYVTKISPPDKVATYMSVHSFLTGFRMAIAPLVGYAVMNYTHPSAAAWCSLVMISISTLMFLPLKAQIDAKAKKLDQPPQQRFSPANPT